MYIKDYPQHRAQLTTLIIDPTDLGRNLLLVSLIECCGCKSIRYA